MKNCYSLLLCCGLAILSQGICAQTSTLIDPTGDGGFETGTSFAANGWTSVGPSAGTRSWYVGTGQAGYSGTRAAFIGISATTVGTNSAARTVHFYRSVTIPAGATNIQLAFKYKQAAADYAAGTPPTYYDYVAVYTSNAAPTNGNLPGGGVLRFGPYPSVNVPNFTSQAVAFPDSLAGTTTNLIFTFKSDNISPNGYGAVDDISLTYTPPPACSGTPTAGTISSSPASVCSGGAATLSLSGATSGVTGLTYQWKSSASASGPFAAVASGGTGTTYATGALTQTTYYTADVTCSGSTATTPVYTVVVNPLPTVSVSPSSATVCSGITQTFTATTTAATPSYVWKRGATIVSGATAAAYAASTGGTYTVTVTDGTTGCSATSSTVTFTVMSGPAVSVSPATASLTCGTAPVALTASSNYYLSGTQLGAEDFNNGTGTFTVTTLPTHTTGTFLPYGNNYTYTSEALTFTTTDASNFVLVNSDSAGSGQKQRIFLTSPAYSTSGQNIVAVALDHYYEYWSSGDSAVQLQASVDGINWTVEADILASGSRGSGGTFVTDTFLLPDAYANKPAVYFRLLYATTYGYYYSVNDFKLLGLAPPAFAWTPAQGLYTDAAATTPYTSGNALKVYAKPTSTTTYFASASNGTCSGSAGRSVAVSDPTGMTLAAATTSSPTLHTNTGTSTTVNIRNENCELVAAVKPNTGAPVRGFVRSKVFVDAAVPTVNGTPYVQRHYEITPDTGAATATGTVTLYATQAEFTAYNAYVTANNPSLPLLPTGGTDNGNVRVTKKSGTSTTGTPSGYTPGVSALITPTSVTWDATNNWWAITFPVTGFSGFFIHTTNTGVPLSLQLLSFSGRVQGPHNDLEWTVRGDEAGAVYTVERSTGGATFEAIGTVTGTNDSRYTHTDRTVSGTAYYRLAITEASGEMRYSAVVLVRRGEAGGGTVTLSPVPAQDQLVITCTDASLAGSTATVLDVQGREVARLVMAPSTPVDVSGWLPGSYILRLVTGEVLRIVKQ